MERTGMFVLFSQGQDAEFFFFRSTQMKVQLPRLLVVGGTLVLATAMGRAQDVPLAPPDTNDAADVQPAPLDTAQDTADRATDQAQNRANRATDRAQDTTNRATDRAQDTTNRATDRVRNQADQATDTARNRANQAIDRADRATDAATSNRSATVDADASAQAGTSQSNASLRSQFGAGLQFRQDGTVRVQSVDDTGTAGRIGLQTGDEILAIDGQPIQSQEQLRNWLADNPAAQADIRIRRNGRERTLQMAGRQRAALGVTFRTDADQGLVIGRVAPGSPAAQLGLRPGDRITQLDGRQFSDVDLFIDAVGQSSLDEDVSVHWMRNGQPLDGTIALNDWQTVYGYDVAHRDEERTSFYRDGQPPRGRVNDIAPPPDGVDAPPQPPALRDGIAPPQSGPAYSAGPACAPGTACATGGNAFVPQYNSCQPVIQTRCCRTSRKCCRTRYNRCCSRPVIRSGCCSNRVQYYQTGSGFYSPGARIESDFHEASYRY